MRKSGIVLLLGLFCFSSMGCTTILFGKKSVYKHIRELGELRDEGLITEEEFTIKKRELLELEAEKS